MVKIPGIIKSLTPNSNSQTEAPIVMDVTSAAGGKLLLPVGNAILDAEFTRSGRDLVLDMPDQKTTVITNYFASSDMPALISDSGKQIRPETISLLAGDPTANQFAGPAEMAAPIGEVAKLGGDVFVTRADGSEVKLSEGDPVFQNDVIQTKADGNIGISFVDGSVFTLGSEARMTLDSLVYDPATGEGSSEVTVIKGMFKFISGEIAANNPGDMVVETPVATIGIRGTTGGGNVQGPGMDNQFFLEPNADGTVGWFDVTTEQGTVSMNQPFQQVGVVDINQMPPPPQFMDPQVLDQQFNSMNQFVPQGRYNDRPEGTDSPNDSNTQQGADAQPEGEAQPDGQPTTGEGEGEPQPDQAAGEATPPSGEELPPEEMTAGEELPPEGSELMGEGNPMMDGDPMPEGSELMGEGETPPDGTMGADAPPPDGENLNGEMLTQVDGTEPTGDTPPPPSPDGTTTTTTGSELFVRTDDPTSNQMDKFVNDGSTDQMLSSPQPKTASTTQTSGTTSGTQTTSTAPKTSTTPQQATTTSTTQSGDQFFKTVQEQIRLGNLPQDSLTNPDGTITLTGTPPTGGSTGGSTTPPPPPPPEDTTNAGGDTTTGGGDTTTGGTGGGGGGAGPLTIEFANPAAETINGGAGSDTFVVNTWANYFNGTIADQIIGGAGTDTLQLNALDGGGNFVATHFNPGNNSIETIWFTAATTGALNSLTLSDAIAQQTGTGHIFLDFEGHDFTADVSGFTTGHHATFTNNESTDTMNMTLSGGSDATITLDGLINVSSATAADEYIIQSNATQDELIDINLSGTTGSQQINIFGSNQTNVTTGTGNDVVTIAGGHDHNISLGGGYNEIDITGGLNANVNMSGIENEILMSGGSGHSINITAGNNDVEITGGSNSNFVTAGGIDEFRIHGGLNHTVDAGAGENFFDIGSSDSTLRNWSISGGANGDHFKIGDIDGGAGGVNGATINGGEGFNNYAINSGTNNLTIQGGSNIDNFDIAGNGTLDLDGGINVGSTYNNFWVNSFGGTANIDVHSDHGTNSSDNIEINKLGATAQVNLIMNGSGSELVRLQIREGFGDGATTSQTGNNLVFTTGSGGKVTLNDFFLGTTSNAYELKTNSRDSFLDIHMNEISPVEGSMREEIRDLGSIYSTSGIGAPSFFSSVTTTAASPSVTATVNVDGLQVGDEITLSGIGAIDGVTMDGTWIVSSVAGNVITFNAGSAATNGEINGVGAGTVNINFMSYGDISRFSAMDINVNTGAALAYAGGGNDNITAMSGDSATTTLIGGDGSDTITASTNDYAKGQSGNDTLSKHDGDGNVTMDGGDGFDMVDYSNQTGGGVVVDLSANSATVVGGNDSLVGIEGAIGTSAADYFYGSSNTGAINHFVGGGGTDTLFGGTNPDNINIADYVTAGSGIAVTLDASGAAVSVSGGDTDELNDINAIIGSAQGDSIASTGTGSFENNYFYGQDGNDTLEGGFGEDLLVGGRGSDIIYMYTTGNGMDDARDIALYRYDDQTTGSTWNSGWVDTIHGFQSVGSTNNEDADAIDITELLRFANLHDYDYFELVREGHLKIVDGGGTTLDIQLKVNGSYEHFVTLDGVYDDSGAIADPAVHDVNWRNFITDGDDNYVETIGSFTGNNDHRGDLVEIDANTTFATITLGSGDDTAIFYQNTILNSISLDGEGDIDRLVANSDIDFSAGAIWSATNFEILDLYGHVVQDLTGNDVWNLSGDTPELFVQNSHPFNVSLGSLNIDIDASAWQVVDTNSGDFDLQLLHQAQFDTSGYTTYKADASGTDVFVHVQNGINVVDTSV